MPVNQGFPINNQPVVDPNTGQVTQSWRQFFVSLWNRTGSSAGSSTFFPGDVKASAADAAQDGWLVCDGAAVSRSVYAGLFSAIGETWGPGDGFSTFNLPDLRGRALIGFSGAHPIATTGGAASVNLAVNQLPAHNHPVVDPGHDHPFTADPHTHIVTDPGHIHGTTDPGHHHTEITAVAAATAGAAAGGAVPGAGNTGDAITGITVNNHVTGITNQDTNVTGVTDVEVTGITTGNTGAGVAVPTQSPYAAVSYLIKT